MRLQADDYHVTSIRHAAALGNEVLQIKALLVARGDGSPRGAPNRDPASDVRQQLLKSVSRISSHLEELHALHRRYPGQDATAALQRVDRQVLALIGTTDPYQSSLALHSGSGLRRESRRRRSGRRTVPPVARSAVHRAQRAAGRRQEQERPEPSDRVGLPVSVRRFDRPADPLVDQEYLVRPTSCRSRRSTRSGRDCPSPCDRSAMR